MLSAKIIATHGGRLTGINTTPLLKEHNQPSSSNPLKVIHRPDAVGVLRNLIHKHILALLLRQLRRRLSKRAFLKHSLGLDLQILDLNQFMLNGDLAHPSQSFLSLIVPALLDQPSGREGHKPDTACQEKGRNTLDDGRQTPGDIRLGRARSTNIVAAVANPEGDHDAEDGCELVEGDQETAHLRCGKLGVVQRANTAEQTNAQTGEETAGIQQGRVTVRGANVQVAAQDDPAAGEEHGVFAGEDLAQDTGGERADDSSHLQDGCQPARGSGGCDD